MREWLEILYTSHAHLHTVLFNVASCTQACSKTAKSGQAIILILCIRYLYTHTHNYVYMHSVIIHYSINNYFCAGRPKGGTSFSCGYVCVYPEGSTSPKLYSVYLCIVSQAQEVSVRGYLLFTINLENSYNYYVYNSIWGGD